MKKIIPIILIVFTSCGSGEYINGIVTKRVNDSVYINNDTIVEINKKIDIKVGDSICYPVHADGPLKIYASDKKNDF